MCNKETGPDPATDSRAHQIKTCHTLHSEFDIVKFQSQKIFEKLRDAFLLHSEARRLVLQIVPKGNNYTKCNHVRYSADVPIVRNAQHKRAYYTNLIHCSNPFLCPLCGPRISSTRTAEHSFAVRQWLRDPDHTFYMVTLTAAHSIDDDLYFLMPRLLKARDMFWAHRTVKEMLSQMGSPLGALRSFEIMYGKNGYHPHFHCGIWGKVGVDLPAIAGKLKRIWLKCLRKAGLHGSIEHGLNVIEARSAEDYLSKISLELGLSSNKTGRSGGKTPFDLLRLSAAGDHAAGKCFQHIYSYFHDHPIHSLRWPNGGKRFFGIDEVTDDQICSSRDDEYQIFFRLAPELWDLIKSDHEAKAKLLSLASVDDRKGFTDYLVRYMIKKGLYHESRSPKKAPVKSKADASGFSPCTLCNCEGSCFMGDWDSEHASVRGKAILYPLQSSLHSPGEITSG